jgi:hypothetical protein
VGADLRITGYINGTQVGTQLFAGINLATTLNNQPVRIGHMHSNQEHFNGLIDEVRIWNTALSGTTLTTQKDCELVGTEIDLVGYYRFNQGVTAGNNAGLTTLNDVAGTAQNGTLSNFALTGATSNWVTGASLGYCATTTITDITPTSGGIDTRITITGTNFVEGQPISINGVPARRVWYYSPTQVVAQIGDGTTVRAML